MRMFTAGQGLVRALENDEANPDLEPVDAAPAADSAETEIIEVNEGAADVVAADAGVEEAVEAATSLESYVVALESAAQNGGLDRQGAQVLNVGLTHIRKRMGFESADRMVVSMESFGQASSRMGANQRALEGIKDDLAKIWRSIVEHIKKAIEWIKGHFNKVFGAAEKLQKRAKALSEKAKGVNGTAKEKSFDNDRLVKALAVNGSVPSNPSQHIAKVRTIAELVFNPIAEFNAKGAEEILKELSEGKGDVASISYPAFTPGALKEVSNPKDAGFGEPHANLALFRSDELPGNKAVLGEVPKAATTGEDAVKVGSKTTIFLGAFNPKAKDATKTTVTTLDVSECGKIGDEVDELMAEVIKYRSKLSKMGDLKDKVVKAIDKVAKDATTEEDKGKAAFYSAQQKMTTNVVSNLDRAPSAMSAYAINTAKAALDYAELSLKQYAAK